jgi:hypothetical protein
MFVAVFNSLMFMVAIAQAATTVVVLHGSDAIQYAVALICPIA